MKDRTKSNFIINTALGIFFTCVILFAIFNEWIIYWVWYKPLYTLFPGSLTLSFYLYIVFMMLFSIGIMFGSIWLLKSEYDEERPRVSNVLLTLSFAVASLFGLLFIGRDAYRDIKFINEGKFLTAECSVDDLHAYRSAGLRGRTYYISGRPKDIDGKRISIKMNLYFYREMLKLQREDTGVIVTVYYLPNTNQVLKYE